MEIDLEKTDEVPAYMYAGNIYNHADDYNKAEVVRWRTGSVRLGVGLARPGADATVYSLPHHAGARSPLFRAAMDLLRQEPDQLAVMCKLLDAFPRTPHAQVAQALRECAVLFVHAGIQPAKVAP
jgi:hypothetical protein